MADQEVPNGNSVIFGRAADIAFLMERTQRTGVTAVVGPPQMGKSTLMKEVERQLSGEGGRAQSAAPHSLRVTPPLVGFVKSSPEHADSLRRAVENLYTRWLGDATYLQQARMMLDQQKTSWVSRVGKAVGSLLESIGKAQGAPGAALGTFVRLAFDELASANQDLTTPGRQQLSRLQADDSRELLRIVYNISGRHAVLFFDQWEESSDLDKELGMLLGLIREVDEWPPCHIVLGATPGEYTKKLQRYAEGDDLVVVHSLGPIDTSTSATRDQLLAYVREHVEAARYFTDDELLEQIGGHPRVLSRWTSVYAKRSVHSRQDLIAMARTAASFSYPEFDDLLPKLVPEARKIAIRLLLMPATSDADDWRVLNSMVLRESRELLDGLGPNRGGVLESEANKPPSYGHGKRAEAAFAWVKINCHWEMCDVCEQLILDLASEAHGRVPHLVLYLKCLAHLRSLTAEEQLSKVAQALCEAAYSLLPGKFTFVVIDRRKFSGIVNEASSETAATLALGLSSALCQVTAGDELEEHDELLEQLRQMAAGYPSDESVRETLARSLLISMQNIKYLHANAAECRQSFLEEMRVLVRKFSQDSSVRRHLAYGLSLGIEDALERYELTQQDSLIQELRELLHADPADEVVRTELVRTLSNTGRHPRAGLERTLAVLDELRELQRRYPDDGWIPRLIAASLLAAINGAEGQEPSLGMATDLLTELQTLAANYREDPAIRADLARGLLSNVRRARKCDSFDLARNLTEEARSLALLDLEDAILKDVLCQLDLLRE